MKRHRLMLLWTAVVFPSWLVLPFVAAGQAAWTGGWTYFAVVALGFGTHGRYVAKRNPELRRHRKNIGQGTKRWDIAWNLCYWPLMAMVAVVAGLDARYGWSSMSAWLWPWGLLLFTSALAISARAMAVNPHFEGTVRIQTEREHRVIDAGPYRAVRHPGYVGLVLWAVASPFLLGSWAAFLAALVVVAWLILRIALEDALLRRELAGYEQYARRVRFRLIPCIW